MKLASKTLTCILKSRLILKWIYTSIKLSNITSQGTSKAYTNKSTQQKHKCHTYIFILHHYTFHHMQPPLDFPPLPPTLHHSVFICELRQQTDHHSSVTMCAKEAVVRIGSWALDESRVHM